METVSSPNWINHKNEWLHVQQVVENGFIKTYVNGVLNTVCKLPQREVLSPENEYKSGVKIVSNLHLDGDNEYLSTL